MKNKYYLIVSIILLLVACGKKKQTLEAEKVNDETEIAITDTTQHSSVIYNAAKEVQFNKISEPQIGKKIVGKDLIKLNLAQKGLEEKEINLDDFYTKVSYITLKHPFADQEMDFLGNSEIQQYTRREQGTGSMFMAGFNSKAYLNEDYIIAGDNYLGYHVYDKGGAFLYTLTAPNKGLQYNRTLNSISYYTNDLKGIVNSFSVLGSKALINVREDSTTLTHLYDISKQKGIMAFRGLHPSFIINDNSFLSYNWSINIKNHDSYLNIFSYSEQDNSLTSTIFRSYNPEVTSKGRRSSPERHTFVYYNNILTSRQAYNDTIYRIKNRNTLEAAYILDSGSLKLSNKDASSENKAGKLIIKNWLETNDFMLITATIDQDFPNNRKDNKVNFRYYFYDKKEAKLYLKEGNSLYPEEYTFSGSIEGAIPLLATTAKQLGKKLYTSYSKPQLKQVIDSNRFKTYSSQQQEKLQSMYNNLSDGELLIAIFE